MTRRTNCGGRAGCNPLRARHSQYECSIHTVERWLSEGWLVDEGYRHTRSHRAPLQLLVQCWLRARTPCPTSPRPRSRPPPNRCLLRLQPKTAESHLRLASRTPQYGVRGSLKFGLQGVAEGGRRQGRNTSQRFWNKKWSPFVAVMREVLRCAPNSPAAARP